MKKSMDALSATSADPFLEPVTMSVQEETMGVLAPKEASSIVFHVLVTSTSWMINMRSEIDAVDIVGFPASFWMPKKDFESVAVWVHEFSESALLEAIAKVAPGCEWNLTAVLQGGKEHITAYIHIITALHSPSCLVDRWITPEEFIFTFLGNRLRRRRDD